MVRHVNLDAKKNTQNKKRQGRGTGDACPNEGVEQSNGRGASSDSDPILIRF